MDETQVLKVRSTLGSNHSDLLQILLKSFLQLILLQVLVLLLSILLLLHILINLSTFMRPSNLEMELPLTQNILFLVLFQPLTTSTPRFTFIPLKEYWVVLIP